MRDGGSPLRPYPMPTPCGNWTYLAVHAQLSDIQAMAQDEYCRIHDTWDGTCDCPKVSSSELERNL